MQSSRIEAHEVDVLAEQQLQELDRLLEHGERELRPRLTVGHLVDLALERPAGVLRIVEHVVDDGRPGDELVEGGVRVDELDVACREIDRDVVRDRHLPLRGGVDPTSFTNFTSLTSVTIAPTSFPETPVMRTTHRAR
ncbi:MAG: hypothetical protein R2697_12545 [Ilumatobacteraceae bacterium]